MHFWNFKEVNFKLVDLGHIIFTFYVTFKWYVKHYEFKCVNGSIYKIDWHLNLTLWQGFASIVSLICIA